MKRIFLNVFFGRLAQIIVIALALSFQITFIDSSYICPEELLNLNCSCKSSANGLVRVECTLSNNNTISSIFNILNSSTEKIDKVSVLNCKRPIELLEPLPEIKVTLIY